MKSNQPLFSILIASYNNGQFIQDAFDSILSQSYSNWEVIIVDDSSEDNSIELIENAKAADPRIRLFQNPKNKGVGFTKSKCAEIANGEIMGFLDPDDQLLPEALKTVVSVHLDEPNASMVYSNCYICEADLSINKENKVESPPKGYTFMDCLDDPKVSTSHFASFKTEHYKKTEGMDKACKRAIDMDLYYKLEEVGKIIHIDKPLYKYRMHGGGLSISSTNAFKADAWHIYVIINACQRRGLNFEDYVTSLITRNIIAREHLKREFKVGKFIVQPARKIKNIFK